MPRFTVLLTSVYIMLACTAAAQAPGSVGADQPLTLEECRRLALANNKSMQMRSAESEAAEYRKREARAAYLPALDFTGAYLYNQKNLSVISEDAHLPVQFFDPLTQSYQYEVLVDPLSGQPILHDGQPIPLQTALLPKEALTFDIHNVFAGALTLTQPIFMGGKIAAMNALADAGRRAARALADNEADNVVYNVDAAYWLVVSLKAKQRLARSYVELLDTLQHDVNAMLSAGVATRADLLSVDVKLNQANVDLTKVDNGLALSRMALAQKCGLPISTPMMLADEGSDASLESDSIVPLVDMAQVYARRNDVRALDAAIDASKAESRVALSSMLPNVALVGAYTFTTPNMFDGFKNRVDGMFSVGVMATVPLWHWGGNYYKYKAARTAETVARLRKSDAEELIDLQVNQARYKVEEAVKTLRTARANMAKADENLRCARLAFQEGVSTTELVMEAQTAWLKAASEEVDARIDLKLCHVYLRKALGTLDTPSDLRD